MTTADPNRQAYNDPEVVREYGALTGLSPVETRLVDDYLRPGMDVLDLGVGGGRTVPALRSIAARYVGVDYAEKMIEHCRARFPDAELYVDDASDLSRFDDRSFDAVVFSFNGIDYLHPYETRRRCQRECARVLRPGGVFVFSSRNPRAVLDAPGEDDKSATGARASLRRWVGNGRRATRTMLHGPFWTGRGYEFTSAHGGLLMFRSTPRHVVHEVERSGFEHLETLGARWPERRGPLSTYWYYYVFRRP